MWERSEDEIVCLDLRTSTYFTLNATAAALWGPLTHGSDTADLVRVLEAEFGAPTDEATADVKAFLQDLDQRGLLEAE